MYQLLKQHLYSKKEVGFMHLRINPLYYYTKSFSYNEKYKQVIELFSQISNKSDNGDTYLTDKFLRDFFDQKEFATGYSIYKHDCSKNIKEANNSNFAIFNITDKIKEQTAINNNYDSYYKLYNSLLNIIRKYCTENNNKTSNELQPLLELLEKRDGKKIPLHDIADFHRKIGKYIAALKSNNYFYNNVLQKDSMNSFNQISTKFEEMENIVNADIIMKNDTQILALISKFGVINICCVSTKKGITIEFKNNLENKKWENQVILKSINCAKSITSYMNNIPKFLQIFDLNKLLNAKRKIVFDYNTLKSMENNDIESITKQIPGLKAIYLRFVLPPQNCIKKDDITAMMLYDYISILVAKEHSYDSLTLWNYINNKPVEELKNVIFDCLKNTNKHLYYDDNLFTISVINPLISSNNLAYLLNSNDPSVSVEKSKNIIPQVSHQARIYAYYQYIHICNTITFASISHTIKLLFNNYCRKKVLFTNIKERNLSYLSTEIENSLMNIFLTLKSHGLVSEFIFEHTNIKNLKDDFASLNTFSWRRSELLSTKKTYWLSTSFTIINLIITILGFGMISKICIDSYRLNNENYYNLPPNKINDLLCSIFQTTKVYLFIIITFAVLLLTQFLFHIIKVLTKENNLPKLCKIKFNKKQKSQK